MSTEENKTIVRRFILEVLQTGNMSLIDQLCAPNYVNRMTGQGIDSFKQMSGLMKTAISDYHVTIENLVAEGDQVVALHHDWNYHRFNHGFQAIRKSLFSTRFNLLSSR